MTLEIILVVVLAVLVSLYLSQTAARLDRLHHRVETSRMAANAQFQERANAVLAMSSSGRLDLASSFLLADASSRALETARDDQGPFDAHRCAAESTLTEALWTTFTTDGAIEELQGQTGGDEARADLAVAVQKAAWTRRFHNDAVRACLAVRHQRLVRLFRLAGSAPWPHMVELNDEVPDSLRVR